MEIKSFQTSEYDMVMLSGNFLKIRHLNEHDRRLVARNMAWRHQGNKLIIKMHPGSTFYIEQKPSLPIPIGRQLPSPGSNFRGRLRINVLSRPFKKEMYGTHLVQILGQDVEEQPPPYAPPTDVFDEFNGYMQLKRY